MREPFVQVIYKGADLVPRWGPSLISVKLVDERGQEGDKLTIELDDRNGETEVPDPDETVAIIGGYRGDGSVKQGEFEIDSVDLEGYPQKIVINGTSASVKQTSKERRTEAHRKQDAPDLGALAGKIAKRNGWELKITDGLRSIPVQYEGQSAESDLAFLNRLVERYGALAAVKQGTLIVKEKGTGTSVSGAAIGGLTVAPGLNLKGYRVSRKKAPAHGKVEASTFDRRQVKKITINAGQGEITYRMREPFKSEAEARKAAESKLSDIARGEASAQFTIEGEPAAAAEEPVIVSGVRDKVDGRWNPFRVEHGWTDDGYETVIDCELPNAKQEKAE